MCTEKSHLCEFKTTTKFNNSNTDKTAIHLYTYAIADVARVKHCIRDHEILLQLLSCNSRINKTIELKSNKIISIYFSTKVKPLQKSVGKNTIKDYIYESLSPTHLLIKRWTSLLLHQKFYIVYIKLEK